MNGLNRQGLCLPASYRRWTRCVAIALMIFALCLCSGAGARGDEGEPEVSLIKPKAVRSLLLDGALAGELTVVVGERGHVLLSRDRGETWRQVEVPTRAVLTAVFLLDERHGWAVGHDAVILRTTDGGEVWERVHWAPEEERPLLDVWFWDENHGIAVGAYGYYLETFDGGDSWTSRLISGGDEESMDDYYYEAGGDFHLNHVSQSASGRMYIAAEAGTILRSDDQGESWVSLPSPYDGSFFSTLPLEEDKVLLLGLRGHLFLSEDGGENWLELETGTQAMLTDAIRLDDGSIVVAGLAGTLLISDDGGASFTLRSQQSRLGISAVLATAEDRLILVGEGGVKTLPLAALRSTAE